MEIRTRQEEADIRSFGSDIRKNGDGFTKLSTREKRIWKRYSVSRKQRVLKKAETYAARKATRKLSAIQQMPSTKKWIKEQRQAESGRQMVQPEERGLKSSQSMRTKSRALQGYLNEGKGWKNTSNREKTILRKELRAENKKNRTQRPPGRKQMPYRMLHYIRRELAKEQIKEDAREQEQKKTFLEESRQTVEMSVKILGIPFRLRKEPARLLNNRPDPEKHTKMDLFIYIGGALMPLLLIFILLLSASTFLSSEEETDQTVGSSNGEAIVAYAREWIGKTRYVWGAGRGGKEDWMDYADCSSFVSGVFSHFDYDIGSTTYAMEVSGGTVIETNGTDQALPGDLILFYSGSISANSSSHVAIYSGNGNMIHCSGGPENYDAAHAGKGVCESSVSSDGRPYQVRRVADSDILSAQQLIETLDTYAKEIKKGPAWQYGYDGAETFDDEKKEKRMITEAQMVTWALRDIGVFGVGDGFALQGNQSISYMGGGSSRIRKYCETISCYKSIEQLKKEDTLQIGDICLYADHINVYAGDGKWYDVRNHSGKITSIGPGETQQSKEILQIFRLKGTAGPSGKELVRIIKNYDKEIQDDIKNKKNWHVSRLFGAGSFQKAIAPDGNKRLNGPRLACWGLYDLGILEYGQIIYWSQQGKLVMNATVKKELKESCKILEVKQPAAKLIKSHQLKTGDICFYGSKMQVAVYAGKGKGYSVPGVSAQSIRIKSLGPSEMPSGIVKAIIRINEPVTTGGIGTGGHKTDATAYTQAQLELIWAIVAQEDNGSYEGSLAVISTAMNRVDSPRWAYCGSNALQQLTAPGQFCYSIDDYWRARLGGNVPDYTKKAVEDCLKRGIRNHPYTCFRSTKGSETGNNAVQIGANGNWYFGN